MDREDYLQCERRWTFLVLCTVGGFFGAYTYLLRGGVFCNAQTGNIVLLGMALGRMDWGKALYLLIPIGAYLAGAAVSEYLDQKLTRVGYVRWDTLLVGFEFLVTVFLGLLPAEAPDQICQVALNFICSMQYNTFRQAEGMPMATTFCTNHIRMIAVAFVKDKRDGNAKEKARWHFHVKMILAFLVGGIISTVGCQIFKYRTIMGASLMLAVVFFRLLHADLTSEKALHSVLPHGH